MMLAILALGWFRADLWALAVAHRAWTASWLFVGLAAFAVTVPLVVVFLARDWNRDNTRKVFPGRHPSRREIVQLFVFEIAFMVAANVASWRWLDPVLPAVSLPRAAPDANVFALEIAACLLVGDALLWLYHWVVHKVRFLRVYIHGTHHTYKYPYVLGGIYTHPIENLIAAGLQLVWPALVATHPFSWWSAFLVWTAVQLEEHSGYDVWWSGAYWLPFGIGARIHAVHHIDGSKNFGFVFTLWDRLAGTYREPPPLPGLQSESYTREHLF